MLSGGCFLHKEQAVMQFKKHTTDKVLQWEGPEAECL